MTPKEMLEQSELHANFTQLPDGRWKFSAWSTAPGSPGKHHTKWDAWVLCCKLGDLVGVPHHGWSKRHNARNRGRSNWCWISLSPEFLANREARLRAIGVLKEKDAG